MYNYVVAAARAGVPHRGIVAEGTRCGRIEQALEMSGTVMATPLLSLAVAVSAIISPAAATSSAAGGGGGTTDAGAWVAGPLAKILPSTLPPTVAPAAAAWAILDGARSQHVQFQIALRPPLLGGSALRKLAVVPSALSPVGGGGGRSPIGSAAFAPARRVVCVRVSNKDGTSAGIWPDPLPLLSSDPNATIAPNTTSALWVELAVPRDTAPGTYAGSVTVLAAGQFVVRVPVSLTVWNFSVAQRSLRTDSKLSEQWVSRFRAREPGGGANLTAIVLNYYREMMAHRVTMMGWGGTSIFPSIAANFSAGEPFWHKQIRPVKISVHTAVLMEMTEICL